MMKKSLTLVIAIALSQGVLLAEAVVGQAAPAFEVKDVEGNTHQLKEYQGKIVILENYNLDCPYVLNHYKAGAMQELQREATGQGAVWLVVNSSYKEGDKAKKEQATQKMSATAVVHDPSGKIGKSYGFKTTPHMVVINKEGVVAYNGAIDDKASTDNNPREAHNFVRDALKQVAAGQPVAKAQTKPYGCSVKYAQ